MPRIGVMALQGGYGAHLSALRELGHHAVEVRSAADFRSLDGLVLPGGESTTQLKLIQRHCLKEALSQFVARGKPVLATCAGIILAAREVRQPSQMSFGWLDIVVDRNAWGRQIDSFEARADAQPPPSTFSKPLPLVFIRAPRIAEVGSAAQILSRYRNEPIFVQQKNVFGATFHPELTNDRRLHELIFGSNPKPRSADHGPKEDADRNDDHPRWRAVAEDRWRSHVADFSVVDLHIRG
jgi:5'-phosphate synthase pdxT subunit